MEILRMFPPTSYQQNLLEQFCHTLVLLVWVLFCLDIIWGMLSWNHGSACSLYFVSELAALRSHFPEVWHTTQCHAIRNLLLPKIGLLYFYFNIYVWAQECCFYTSECHCKSSTCSSSVAVWWMERLNIFPEISGLLKTLFYRVSATIITFEYMEKRESFCHMPN